MCFNRVLRIHDTCSVHSTFGLPGLLGGINYIVLMTFRASWTNNPMWVIWLIPLTLPPNSGRNVPRALSWGVCIQDQALIGLSDYFLANLFSNFAQYLTCMESSPFQATSSFQKEQFRCRAKADSSEAPQKQTEQGNHAQVSWVHFSTPDGLGHGEDYGVESDSSWPHYLGLLPNLSEL